MKRYLITGSEGFVGRHFVESFKNVENVNLLGLDIGNSSKIQQKNYDYRKCNLQDKDSIFSIISDFEPNYIVHLAAFSSVGDSWKDPEACFKNNTDIFINILESVKVNCNNCRILSVGSSEEYGNIKDSDIPVKEDIILSPNSPYAVARVSQELLSKVYSEGYGLDIVLTRSFNHIGPGQRPVFAIPAFVKKILQSENTIEVGNLSAIRDFTDVRDVIRAYKLLLENGVSGEVYNICSGQGRKLEDIVEEIKKKTNKTHINNVINPSLMRPVDLPIMIGDNSKIKKYTSWKQEYDFDRSLDDIIEYFKENDRYKID